MASKIFILFSFFCMLTSFGVQEPDYCQIAGRLTGIYEKEFARPRGLRLYGYGGAMMDDIKKIELRFSSFNKLSIEAARKLYIEMMEEILIRINQDAKIRPYLHDFPVGINNIKLAIGFNDKDRHILGDGHVAHMFIGKNDTLYYAAYNADVKEFYILHKENYTEALNTMQNTKMDNLQSD